MSKAIQNRTSPVATLAALAALQANGTTPAESAPAPAPRLSLWESGKSVHTTNASRLNGRLSGQFDYACAVAMAHGVPNIGLVEDERENVLRLASLDLKGSHSSKGNVAIQLGKALNAAIKRIEHDDRDVKSMFETAWKRACGLASLYGDKVEFDISDAK